MFPIGKKFGLSVYAITLMLIGTVALPASAAYVNVNLESNEQSFVGDPNGHTYLYVDPNEDVFNREYLTHNEDIDITRYSYSASSWTRETSSFDGPADRSYTFESGYTVDRGWLGNDSRIARFFDFANTTEDPLSVGAVEERVTFPLAVGTPSEILMDAGQYHYGTFNITDEEYIHLTIASRMDSGDIEGIVIDPQGRYLMEFWVGDGDIDVIGFNPSGPGMYVLMMYVNSDSGGLSVADITLEAITPTLLPVGTSITDVLPGSEYLVDPDTGSLIHEEKAPSAHTYKFSSNFTYPGEILYSMNLPELDSGIYDWYEPWILVTSDAFVTTDATFRYMDIYGYDDNSYYFQSFQNETYYMTVIGMENVEYTLFHDMPIVEDLPINEVFYHENWESNVQTIAYSLQLAQDSVFRVNSTEYSSGYSWSIWSVFDNMIYRSMTISDNAAFSSSSMYYLPAGNYIVTAYTSSYDAGGFYKFNFGPVVDGLGSVSVDNGAIIGVRFDTAAMDWYNVSVMLNTHDNVTIDTDIKIFNSVGGTIINTDRDLGNRQSGVGWDGYLTNFSSWITSSFCDGFGIVAISPAMVENNTAGLGGNEFNEYSADYSVNVEDGLPWQFNGTDSLSVGAVASSYNFTLGQPCDLTESYLLTLDATEGTWYNVSVYVDDVVDWQCEIYQKLDSCYQYLSWNSLDDTFTGFYVNESAFQFGSISDTISMIFTIDRQNASEGVLNIEIAPFVTNNFEYMPSVMFQGLVPGAPAAPPADMGLVLGGVGVVAIGIVVVVVVILKKKPQLLGRS